MQGVRSQLQRDWLATALGEALLQQESRVIEDALDGIFGEECLQLGRWGDSRCLLRFARTQHGALLAETADGGPAAVADFHRLPIETDSVDAVLLPHTLDYSDRPHAILREVDRVLRSNGHVVLLGFKPGGLWGLRRLVPGAGMPPGADYLIPERRLRDWLQLLDMRIRSSTSYFFRWPLPGNKALGSLKWERRGRAWWPELSACYMLSAQKRVSALTPVRPLWRRRAPSVAGLAEPSARASRIRFDQN